MVLSVVFAAGGFRAVCRFNANLPEQNSSPKTRPSLYCDGIAILHQMFYASSAPHSTNATSISGSAGASLGSGVNIK
jgi:hypothetical protein